MPEETTIEPKRTDLSDILGLRVGASVDYHGIVIEFGFRPGAYDDAFHDAFYDGMSANEAITKLVADWSLVHNGDPIPIDEEGVKLVPWVIKRAIIRRITENLSPN